MILRCKMCNANLEIKEGMSVAQCSYCGAEQTLPKFYGEESETFRLYDRADHFRKAYDYDHAIEVYQKILESNPEDAESYWSLVLCKYGIEYVEDFKTKKRIPTINRMQYTSILVDEDYKAALKYADDAQRALYEKDVEEISKIQKNIMAIVEKEEPFDIFICYKESDNNGRRSRDSVLANELYYELTGIGYRVFFSRITLEDKLGVDYEPYIFAALNTAKIMIVVGTQPDFFQSVWVKNEWSRYLNLIKSGEKKQLIPVYRDMDPYDLPTEFAHLQIMDMNDLGFMQDLTRGIGKLIEPSNKEDIYTREVVVNHYSGAVGFGQDLLKNAQIQLNSKNWENASIFVEDILNQNARDGYAYYLKILCIMHITSMEELLTNLENKIKEIIDKSFEFRVVDDKHADEMAKKYKVPSSLPYSKIYKMYYAETYAFLKEDMFDIPLIDDEKAQKCFERAKQYGSAELKSELAEIEKKYEQMIMERKSHLIEKQEKDSIELEDFLKETDEKVRILYEEAYKTEHEVIKKIVDDFKNRCYYIDFNQFESHDSEYKMIRAFRGKFLEYKIYPEAEEMIKVCDDLIAMGDKNEDIYQRNNRNRKEDNLLLKEKDMEYFSMPYPYRVDE